MVALRVSAHRPRNRRRLVAILEVTRDDLALLESEGRALERSAFRKSEVSPRAVATLIKLAREGREKLLSRLTELGASASAESVATPTGASGVAGFMLAYRRCARRMCLALSEARMAADVHTLDLLFHLLRDLERQLWLVDTRRGRVIAADAAPLLQAC